MTTTTKTLTVGASIDVRFPVLNKNDQLSDNDREISSSYRVQPCKVRRVIELDVADWQAVARSLLEDRPELWGQIGGQELSPLDMEAFRVLCRDNGADADRWSTWIHDRDLWSWFHTHCFTEVVAVLCPGQEPFLVNTEGYDYARYVGRLA